MTITHIRSFATLVLGFSIPMIGLADINSTATVNAGQKFSFDSGAVVSSGGDISFSASGIAYVGSAVGGNLGALGATEYAALTQAALQQLTGFASATPIALSSLSVGDIFAIQTNGGNAAKAMVSASSATSISFQFTTYESGSGTGPTAPVVTAVVSGSAMIPAGFPNSGVAPSSLIAIQGTGLTGPNISPVLQDSSKGLPTTLNQTSVSVTVGGKTVTPALYYTCSVSCGGPATQVAAVLPAATPVGTGTITVTYNGTPSAPAPITVVPNVYGIDNYDANTAVAQDAVSYALITYTNSAKPGEYLTIWGTGLGSDPADSDTTETSTPHAINTAVQVYVGGVASTNVTYAGASPYPGVDIIVFQLPASGVPNGCFVPVTVVTGNTPVSSNTPTIPFMNGGGVCSDSVFGENGSQISSSFSQTAETGGSVIVGQLTQPATNGGAGTTTSNVAIATFTSTTGGVYGGGTVSLGACIVNETLTTNTTSTSTGLNAGTITATGASGGPVTLTALPVVAGEYVGQLPSGAVVAGGTVTFTGSGATGANSVGPFTATVTFPNPLLSWTNQSAAATVTRSQGLVVNWTGGTPGSFVIISGSASSGTASGGYTCFAPQSALTFTVPSYVMSALPAGTGTTTVENGTNYTTFTATGIDYGHGFGFSGFAVNTTYN